MAQSQEESWKVVVKGSRERSRGRSRGRKLGGNWEEIGRVRILRETKRELEGDIGKEYKKGIAVGSLRKESWKKSWKEVVEGNWKEIGR